MNTYNRLYRSRKNRIIGGVAGGLGEFFGIDPTLVRVLFVIVALLGWVAPAVIIYLVLLLIVPEAPLAPTAPVEPVAAGMEPAVETAAEPMTETTLAEAPVTDIAPMQEAPLAEPMAAAASVEPAQPASQEDATLVQPRKSRAKKAAKGTAESFPTPDNG
ncbi:MAG: PspC domain-containing protein [Chloroflexota bacterium]|nr:MAG: PspC domain-containing protein [Chloroflexota bacterium]